MQVFAPILLARKLFQTEFQTAITKLEVGPALLLISSHHMRYTLVVCGLTSDFHRLKAFETAAFDIIQGLCGPCWALIQDYELLSEILEKYLLALQKLGHSKPYLYFGMSSSPLESPNWFKNFVQQQTHIGNIF